MGPVALGMSRADVVRALGPADLERSGAPAGDPSRIRHDDYQLAFYVFPRDLSRRLAQRPANGVNLQILQIAYVTGHVAKISNDPPARTWSSKCDRPVPPAGAPAETAAPDFAPFRSFAGLQTGDGVVDRIPGRRLGGRRVDALENDMVSKSGRAF